MTTHAWLAPHPGLGTPTGAQRSAEEDSVSFAVRDRFDPGADGRLPT